MSDGMRKYIFTMGLTGMLAVSPAVADNDSLYVSAEEYCRDAGQKLASAPTIDQATLEAIRNDLEEIKDRLEGIRVSERNYPVSEQDLMRPVRKE